MQWPAAQCMPCAAATVSLAHSGNKDARVSDLMESNKSLRFLKSNNDVGLQFVSRGSWTSLRFGIYTGASWGCRSDGGPRSGYLLRAIDEQRFPCLITEDDVDLVDLPHPCNSLHSVG